MSFSTRTQTALVAAALLLAPTVAQAQTFPVFVGHGIPGDDLGLDVPNELPVDVLVLGPDALEACVPNVQFGDVVEAELPVGAYLAEILASDGSCGGGLLVPGAFSVSVGTTTIVVAHLDPAMNPTVSQFSQKRAELDEGLSILSAVHAASAPTVDVKVDAPPTRHRRYDDSSGLTIPGLRNGDQSVSVPAPSATYLFSVVPAGGKKPVLGPIPAAVDGNVTLVAVGSLGTGSLTVLPVVFGDGSFEIVELPPVDDGKKKRKKKKKKKKSRNDDDDD